MILFRNKDKQSSPGKEFPGTDQDSYPSQILSPGSQAPDFTLVESTGEKISLTDFRGRPVILVLYTEVLPIFEEHNAQLLGISVDGKWSHRAYAEDRNLNFPLLSDFEPKGEVAKIYGVYDAKSGTCQRALFVIDAQGTVQWNHVSPGDINPGADGILTALESITS